MDRRPSDLNQLTDAYRELRAPQDARREAVSRFTARQLARRPDWVPAAAFAAVVGLAVLIVPNDWTASHHEASALSPVALARLNLQKPETEFAPSLSSLSAPALSELQAPPLNRLSIPNLTLEQETL